ncbi:hypothetical protein OUZ56_004850 [Daphnia magna]|uniref:Uncharacterized protein n=1 Tax=Daphnia magna TaxID=35525 RepID=A0ABQ9YR38_9CRUS|nr:hypothetical protein OUZ56_004850 [Daphnia magna]
MGLSAVPWTGALLQSSPVIGIIWTILAPFQPLSVLKCIEDNLDKIGDELHMTSNFVKSQPRSSPGSFIGRSEFSSRTPAGYYGQNGGGTIPRSHRRPTQHYSTAAIAESNFLTPSSQTSISGSSRRPGQHPLNGSASMVAEPSLDADDLMNDDSDSASQSSRPGKFISH